VAELRHVEAELETVRQGHYAAGDTLHAAQGELADAALEVSRLEERIRYVVEGRQRVQQRIAELNAQNTQWDQRRTSDEAESARLAEQIVEAGRAADEQAARAIEERFDLACAAMVARGAEIIIPADGVLNEFLVRRRRLTARGGVPVMDSLGALFQHAAFLVRLARTTGTRVSRHQFYAKPSRAMVEHVRRFSHQPELRSDFSGD